MRELAASEMPTVVLGDFNVIPEDKDVWSPPAMADDALMQPESRDAYARLLGDGWTDALDTAQSARRGVDLLGLSGRRLAARPRLPHRPRCCSRPKLADRLVAAGVDKDHRGREKASDHAPVWVELGGLTPYRLARRSDDRVRSAVEDVVVDAARAGQAPAGRDARGVEVQRAFGRAFPAVLHAAIWAIATALRQAATALSIAGMRAAADEGELRGLVDHAAIVAGKRPDLARLTMTRPTASWPASGSPLASK